MAIKMIMKRLVSATCAAGLMGFASVATAQTYPSEPIRLIVGFAAGGSNDVVARILANKVGDLVGGSVVVENRPGAGGAIATEFVAAAKPDGYTLLIGSASTLAINPHTVENIKYKPLEDFVPIASVAMTAEVLAINPNVKAANMQELVALAKTRSVSLASSGTGGLPHLAIELFRTAADANITHVPYKGGAPAATDVVGGHVDGIIMDLPPLQGFIKEGRMRAIAVTSKDRSPFLPDLPTAVELGYTDLIAANWFAIMAPKGTPDDIADKLHDAFTHAANDAEVKKQLASSGVEPMTTATRSDFASFLRAENARWEAVAKKANVAVSK